MWWCTDVSICVYIPTLVALFGLCFDLTECLWDLCIWYRTMGNMSSNLQYVLQIVQKKNMGYG